MTMECAVGRGAYQERLIEFVKKRCDLNEFWRSRTLYLTFSDNTRIWGIKPKPNSTHSAGGDVGTASIVCDWKMPTGQYPAGMGILKRNSKVYMLGGCFVTGGRVGTSPSDVNFSYDVYEFGNPTKVGDHPSLNPCSDLPNLTLPMLDPIIEKVKGDVYVFYGEPRGYRLESKLPPIFGNCALVLRGGSDQWSLLPGHPHFRNFKYYSGLIGKQICMKVGDLAYCFGVDDNKWSVQHPERLPRLSYYTKDSITLSISGTRGYSVVLTARRMDESPNILAQLLDGKDRLVGAQSLADVLPDGLGDLWWCSIIEVEEEEEEEEDGGFSSTFCYLGAQQDGDILGVSVVNVSLSPSLFGSAGYRHLSKKAKKSDAEWSSSCQVDDCMDDDGHWKEDFLVVNATGKGLYLVDGISDYESGNIKEAFLN